jgi:hypothetical protein
LGGEGYGNVRTLSLSNETFNSYMIYFSIIVSTFSLGFKFGTKASGDREDCAMSWERFDLLLGLLDLWCRLGWWIGFVFHLAVVLCWVCDLWDC